MVEQRKTGIPAIGDIAWGTNFCHFYETKQDLLDILIPYFKAGLENDEFCLWVVSDPLVEEEARNALRHAVPQADQYLATGHIEIVPHTSLLSLRQQSPSHRIEIVSSTDWYLKGGTFVPERVIKGWNEKLDQALAEGRAGMRVNANESWLTKENWRDFAEYEQTVDETLGSRRMIVLCSYPLSNASAAQILDVAHTHQFAIATRDGRWETLETPDFRNPNHHCFSPARRSHDLPCERWGLEATTH